VQAQVKGNVVDSAGEPIIGATVMEKGTTNGVITDFDGNFTIKMQSTSHDLQISYVGMKSASVKVGSKTDIKVILEDDATTLNEVVAIGYGSKARKDLTGAVGSVSGAKLAAVPVASAAEALTGKIAGVQVTSVDGQPGGDINIRVRGATSVTQSNEPLYIVDGFQQSSINDIPPSDIASIDVLKDASLTAIYGAKGANGVIVVTTKSAQAGKVKVSFNGRLTLSHISKKLDLMDIPSFVEYTWDRAVANKKGTDTWARQWRYNFGTPYDMDIYNTLTPLDWQDEVMNETPLSYQANVKIGGGNETTKFDLSLTQSEDKGIIVGSGVRRTVLNFKLNTNLHKNLKLSYNPTITYRRDEGAGGEGVGTGGIIDVLKYVPTKGFRQFASRNPKWVDSDEENKFDATNPVADIATNVQKKHSYNFNNKLSLSWTPIAGLVLRSEGNYSITFRDQQRYWGALTSEGKKYNSQPVAQISKRTIQSYTWTNTASYSMDIKELHNFSFLLGQEIYSTQYKETVQKNRYFDRTVKAQSAFDNMGLGTPYISSSEVSTADRTASFFGQVSYNYDHKYLFSATLRGDGSSKFASGYKWGWFPSVSAAWDAKQEKFLKDVKWIDQMKLRFAWGLVGNNNISNDMWRYLYTMSVEGGPGYGEARQYGEMYYTSPSTYPNTTLKWETTVTRNLALDMQFFGGRLTVTPEVYWNTTRDLLYPSTISTTAGYSKQMQNIGRVTNNGFELTINGDILRGKDYVLSANLTMGHNKQKIVALNATDAQASIANSSNRFYSSGKDDYPLMVGEEVGLLYGYVYDGTYKMTDFQESGLSKSTPEYKLKDGVVEMTTDVMPASHSGDPSMPGKMKFKDLDGDGKITTKDRQIIGNTNPKWQGGFGFSGQYKDWDFTMNFSYMLNFDVYNATAYALSSSSGSSTSYSNVLASFCRDNRYAYTLDSGNHDDYASFKSDHDWNEFVAMNANKSLWNPADVTANTINTYFVEDGSFLRLTDITIGYTLPKKWAKAICLSKIRAYVSAGNLFTITGYSGYDPEVDVQSGLTPSMDYNRYPRSRTWSFGINVDF
ncbi:MAG: TonB-dependent receptor, partial [Prevotella sp.]|nr:TonB-dependent receptor [Candidatus Prevotella equi]